jgi:TPR repeat protein
MIALLSDHSSDLNGTRCPGCQRDLCALPPAATFCPECCRRVRPKVTAWAMAARLASRLWWGVEPPIDRSGPRAPVVVGYSKALWRLGWRYEHGRGMSRNVPEAMRCYAKSAGLGNVEAAARIDAAAVEPIAALPLPMETD